jgi:Zn-finger protein
MLCAICGGEFEGDSSVCGSCGCPLVPGTLSEQTIREIEEAAEDKEIQFCELCRPWTHPEAMLIKQTLEQNNVAVLIQGVHSLSVMPHLAFGGQLRVLVGRRQLEYARTLYRAFFENDEETDYIEEE